MKAQNLTISVPFNGCDKNCEYCISRMTGYLKPDLGMMRRNLPKVRNLLERADAAFVLFTGKGEPLLNFRILLELAEYFKDYPIEVQTNGIMLNKHRDWLTFLKGSGVDVFAFSIDKLEQLKKYRLTFEAIAELNLTTRICLNVTDKISADREFMDILLACKLYPIQQLLIRNVMVPDKIVNTKAAAETSSWIEDHVDPERYEGLHTQFLSLADINFETVNGRVVAVDEKNKKLIRKLPHGALVWDYDDIAVSFSDYCIQETNNTEDIRSLILDDTGHLGTSWDKSSSRLF